MANEVYTSFNISASKTNNTVTSGSQGVTGNMTGTEMTSSDIAIVSSAATTALITQVTNPLYLYVKNDTTAAAPLSYDIYLVSNLTGANASKVCTIGPSQFAYFTSPQPMYIRCASASTLGTAFVVSIS